MTRSQTKSVGYQYMAMALLLLGVVLFVVIKAFSHSLFFAKRDRINVVLYGKQTVFYSLGVQESGDYVISFYPDLKVMVPGGYGSYRVGALGKLVGLEKKPQLFQKTFSLATSTFVDYYFYSNTRDVYFGGDNESDPHLPGVGKLLSSKTNASYLDELYLVLLLLRKKPQQFTHIHTIESKNDQGEEVFQEDNFNQIYQGYFYQQTYRDEKKEVQILYPESYTSAQRISMVLEGNGIRVSDVSPDSKGSKDCKIIENNQESSQTAVRLADFFHCPLVKAPTDFYDILFQLGTVEKEW